MPWLIVTGRRNSLPDGCGSPCSSAFSEMPRFTSFSWKTSMAALQRSSVAAFTRTDNSPAQAIEASTPRKSNLVLISFAAWLTALSTSWRSTLLTMSNDAPAMVGVLPLSRLRYRPANLIGGRAGSCARVARCGGSAEVVVPDDGVSQRGGEPCGAGGVHRARRRHTAYHLH